MGKMKTSNYKGRVKGTKNKVPKEPTKVIRVRVSKVEACLKINREEAPIVCPCCKSTKTYKTEAIHCNLCAVTTEI